MNSQQDLLTPTKLACTCRRAAALRCPALALVRGVAGVPWPETRLACRYVQHFLEQGVLAGMASSGAGMQRERKVLPPSLLHHSVPGWPCCMGSAVGSRTYQAHALTPYAECQTLLQLQPVEPYSVWPVQTFQLQHRHGQLRHVLRLSAAAGAASHRLPAGQRGQAGSQVSGVPHPLPCVQQPSGPAGKPTLCLTLIRMMLPGRHLSGTRRAHKLDSQPGH